ncbi:hypothetical protein HYR69_04990 [Candidatus Sumerlaeota bacterium]|nr:hypothetical protein [Candidatus Sumerlaeota bacterium]MBI3736080.1 hypothetical protein [Candidatus Sumerlaeota bacterium]
MIIYTDLAAEIIRDAARILPQFSHLDPARIAVAATTRWAGGLGGGLAHCAGLRGPSDPLFSIWVRRRTRTIIQVSPWYRRLSAEIRAEETRCHYLISLHLPRLLHHNPLETLIHELFHIGESFDGSLRKMRHGKNFDRRVLRLMEEYLLRASPGMASLSQLRIGELRRRFGSVAARTLPPKFSSHFAEAADPPCGYAEGIAKHYPRYTLAPDFKIRPVKFAGANAPRRVALRDCPLHVFHSNGLQKLSPELARYIQPAWPLPPQEAAAVPPALSLTMPGCQQALIEL